jgi:hypothetical protein
MEKTMLRFLIAGAAAMTLAVSANAQNVSCSITPAADCIMPGEALDVEVCVINDSDNFLHVSADMVANAPSGDVYDIQNKYFWAPPGENCVDLALFVPVFVDLGDYDLEVTLEEGGTQSTCNAAVTVAEDCG